jgi:bifunctional DNA-binding transcriptional regulator/antitoxin component of YhaV-PrlF toxin-antitoxin module
VTNERDNPDGSRATDATTTISTDYKVAIPKSTCERLSWRPGQKLVFIPKGAGVLLIAAPTREDLIGLTRGANTEDYRDRDDRY